MTVLSVKDLRIAIDQAGKTAHPVDGIGFAIEAGECYALLGESGCGKSLTALGIMRLLPDVARVVSGGVEFLGENLLALPEAAMRRRRGGGIAMIFQEPATSLNPVLTIGQQISESLSLHGKSDADGRRAIELLTQVGIPDPARRIREYPFQLSGGMRQRVMIAIALAGNPRLLIADEPTTALDVTIQAQVLDLLDDLRRRTGMALLLITHDLGIVARMADRIGVMYAGQLVEEASRTAFFSAPAHPYAQRLFAALPEKAAQGKRLASIPGSVPPPGWRFTGCRFVDRCNMAQSSCREQIPAWREVQVGHWVRCPFGNDQPNRTGEGGSDVPLRQTVGAQSLLEVADLAVHFPVRKGVLQRTIGYVRAVDGISLRIKAGRTLALVGESGCGKTTVGKAMMRLLDPRAGQVLFDGKDMVGLSGTRLRSMRMAVQMIFQDPYASLSPRMRVGEILCEGLRALNIEHDDGVVAGLLDQVGLIPEMAMRYPHEFSGGQRQRIAIARALAVRPKVLICDEPTSALDVSVQAQILNLLNELQRRLGLSYLFITHNISVVGYLAHEVAVMYLGRVVEQGTVEEVLRHPRHPYTQILLAAVPRIDVAQRIPVAGLGDMPSPVDPPAGCHFHPRCPQATAACRDSYPGFTALSATHAVRCHFPLTA